MVVTTTSFIVLRCRLRAQCQGANMIYWKYFCGGQHAADIILLTEVWTGTERQYFVVGLCNQCVEGNHFVLLLRAEPRLYCDVAWEGTSLSKEAGGNQELGQ